MRDTRLRYRLGGGFAVLAGVFGSAGCTHNYYYGYDPCGTPTGPPVAVTTPGAAQYGSVCDVPTQVTGGSSVTQAPISSSVVARSRPPRVVVSEPSGSRLGWRPVDPDGGLATTQVSGAVDEGSRVR